jgi:hypothetical protein
MVVTKANPPLFKPITLEVDMAARTGRVSVPGVIETHAEPIKNPVTGAPHRARRAAGRLRVPRGRVLQLDGEIPGADRA